VAIDFEAKALAAKAAPHATTRNTPSHTCGSCLREPTQVALVCVLDAEGKPHRGASGVYGTSGPGGFTPNNGFTFDGWLTYCGHCYLRQLYRARKGVWSTINDDGIPTQDDYRRLHGASEKPGASGHARHAGAEAKDLVGDPDRSTGVGEALPDVPGPDSGPVVEGRDAIGEAVDPDDYGEALSRRVSRVDPDFCEAWEVYKGRAA
jgi:hypothetical protein